MFKNIGSGSESGTSNSDDVQLLKSAQTGLHLAMADLVTDLARVKTSLASKLEGPQPTTETHAILYTSVADLKTAVDHIKTSISDIHVPDLGPIAERIGDFDSRLRFQEKAILGIPKDIDLKGIKPAIDLAHTRLDNLRRSVTDKFEQAVALHTETLKASQAALEAHKLLSAAHLKFKRVVYVTAAILAIGAVVYVGFTQF